MEAPPQACDLPFLPRPVILPLLSPTLHFGLSLLGVSSPKGNSGTAQQACLHRSLLLTPLSLFSYGKLVKGQGYPTAHT